MKPPFQSGKVLLVVGTAVVVLAYLASSEGPCRIKRFLLSGILSLCVGTGLTARYVDELAKSKTKTLLLHNMVNGIPVFGWPFHRLLVWDTWQLPRWQRLAIQHRFELIRLTAIAVLGALFTLLLFNPCLA